MKVIGIVGAVVLGLALARPAQAAIQPTFEWRVPQRDRATVTTRCSSFQSRRRGAGRREARPRALSPGGGTTQLTMTTNRTG